MFDEKHLMKYEIITALCSVISLTQWILSIYYLEILNSRDSIDWTVRGSNPVGVKFSAPVQTAPAAQPASF